jgi:UDP-glucose 4-epimerase
VDRARELLGWSAQLSVAEGVDSALRWSERRPEVLGYP